LKHHTTLSIWVVVHIDHLGSRSVGADWLHTIPATGRRVVRSVGTHQARLSVLVGFRHAENGEGGPNGGLNLADSLPSIMVIFEHASVGCGSDNWAQWRLLLPYPNTPAQQILLGRSSRTARHVCSNPRQGR